MHLLNPEYKQIRTIASCYPISMKALFCSIFILFMCGPLLASAQITQELNSLSLSTSPRTPEANKEFILSLDAYSYDTTGATITWFVDGVENTEGKNLRSLTLTSKNIGEPTQVDVQIKLRDGSTRSASNTIIPNRLDIIIESDTLTPALYKGRSQPSSGSLVRAIAILDTAEGTNPQQYSYTWKLDNTVLDGGSVQGKYINDIVLGKRSTQILSVSVTDQTGSLIATKAISVKLAKPEIHFYEENALRGMSDIALRANHIISGAETTLRAEPFFMDRSIFDQSPFIEWSIDGRTTQSGDSDPQYLTIRPTAASGAATVEFHIRNLNDLLQGDRSSIRLQF